MSATVVALTVIALAAFATEGAIGFGATVIAASIGAQLVPLDELLPAFVPVNMAMSAWLLVTGIRVVAWRLLIVEIAPAVVVGAAIGLALFHAPGKAVLALAFGAFVAGLAVLRLARPADRPLAPVLRIAMLGIGGVAHGLFGTGGPMIVYVARRRVDDKRAFRATLAALWLGLNVALLVNYAALGLYETRTFELGGALLVAMVPGLWLGNRIHHALDTTQFERVVWILLLVAGLALTIRSALAL